MHPFSLGKIQEEQVVGGVATSKVTYFGGCTEDGGGINPTDPISMTTPEDGNDPRPFPPEGWM